MFAGRNDLALVGDHIDLSYSHSADWPRFTQSGSIRSHAFDFGDPVSGPRVHLSIVEPVEGEVLDWQHSIDPAHYHGSDQFRVISGGGWTVANHPLPAGSYSFQESGIPYREHPIEGGVAWFMLLTGDRRGAPATLMLQRDKDSLFRAGADYGEPVDDGSDYPHPAGPRGIAAVATTDGPCRRGYLHGRLDALSADEGVGTVSGVIGDQSVGPLVHALHAEPEIAVLPVVRYSAETMLVVAGGSCVVGDRTYRRGDIRIQAADAAMPAVVSGPDGLDAVLIVSDRRATSVFADPGEASRAAWVSDWRRRL